MTTTKIMQACDGRIDTSGVCDKCYQPAMTTSTQCGRLVEAQLTTPDMDIQKQIEENIKKYGEQVRETGWSNNLSGVLTHYRAGANFALGLCQKEIAELKEENDNLESKNNALDAANEVLESAIEELMAELKKCAEEENYFTRTAIICKGMQDKYLRKLSDGPQ